MKTVPLNIKQAHIEHPSERWMIDLSNNRRGVDIHFLQQNGTEAIYVKATEGRYYTDPTADGYSLATQKLGMKIGAYMWPWPVWRGAYPVPSLPQVQSFAAFHKRHLLGKILPPMMDIETGSIGNVDPSISNMGVSKTRDWFHQALSEADEALERVCGVYTTSLTLQKLGGVEVIRKLGWLERPLWVAFYESPLPRLPRTHPPRWDHDWLFWQMTSKGQIDGYPRGVDFNAVNQSSKWWSV